MMNYVIRVAFLCETESMVGIGIGEVDDVWEQRGQTGALRDG